MGILAILDETSVGTNTESEPPESLTVVLDTSVQANVTLKISQCGFGILAAERLGLVVDHTRQKPSEKPIEFIHKLTESAYEFELTQLSGPVGFSAVFTNHTVEIAASLYEILKAAGLKEKGEHEQRPVIPNRRQL